MMLTHSNSRLATAQTPKTDGLRADPMRYISGGLVQPGSVTYGLRLTTPIDAHPAGVPFIRSY